MYGGGEGEREGEGKGRGYAIGETKGIREMGREENIQKIKEEWREKRIHTNA